MDQWKMLALDTTPPEWTCESDKTPPAIDDVWFHVLNRRNALGNLKYCTLGKVVKACLAFSHGNADAERSFSANKDTVAAERSNLNEETITAIRLVKDGIRQSGKSASDVQVTYDMINRTRSAHAKYKVFLDEQKKEQERKVQEKKVTEAKAAQREKEVKEKAEQEKEAKRNEDKLDVQDQQLKAEEENLHGVLKTAEVLLSEADDKLKKSIMQKDMEQMSVAQAMLETARQKITHANKSLSDVHSKRAVIAGKRKALTSPSKHSHDTLKKRRV